jgi:DNA polymerase
MEIVETEKELKEIFSHLKTWLLAHQEMGLEPPLVRKETEGAEDPSGAKPPPEGGGTGPADRLESLRSEIGACTRCKLHTGRTHLVFGEGNPGARLVFVGEGPGREEDLAGRPFVGEAGRLLTNIIQKGMGLKRREVYICNVVKCRPPRNRDPERDEIETCLPFLKAQLRVIRPEVICTLGRVAAQTLLKPDFKISKGRGTWCSYEGIPLMPTYHPAFIVRNRGRERQLKREVWEDVKQIMARLGLEIKRDA